VREALETFRWHGKATVTVETYNRLNDAHRLIADVVSFRGPHINHLTPRTLDIDAAQAGMPKRGITPKAVIEGPPRRNCAILLRQTSFKAIEETVAFKSAAVGTVAGAHTARFGEIEQRGAALTPKGRKIYDDLLASVRGEVQVGSSGENASGYATELAQRFKALPDDWSTLRAEGLAFFRYSAPRAGIEAIRRDNLPRSIEALIANGYLRFDPIIYEDFLPVSAAGIFQSNLGGDAQHHYGERANRALFEEALGQPVLDEFDLYARAEKASEAPLEGGLHVHGSIHAGATDKHDDNSMKGGDGKLKCHAGVCCGLFCCAAITGDSGAAVVQPVHSSLLFGALDERLDGRGPKRIGRPPKPFWSL
jgi:uncharacterized glyoxalase superfamily metalloenzyme YdcJ